MNNNYNTAINATRRLINQLLRAADRKCKIIAVIALLICTVASPAQAQIIFRGAGAQVASTGSSVTAQIPASSQAGDVAVLFVAGRPNNATEPTAPSGWTFRSSSLREVGANDLKIMTFHRVLVGGDPNPVISVPSAWQGSSRGISAQIAVWGGVDTTIPFDTADVTGNISSSGNWTPTTISTVTAGAWIVSSVATSDDNELALGTAQSFIARMSGTSYDTTTGGDHAVGLADKVQTVAGTAAMPTWNQTVRASDSWVGITFALRPVNMPPTVNLTSPVNGTSAMAPASITLSATATDSDGTIQKVEFFHNSTNLIATVTSAPYTYTWNNITEGSYVITAKATDNRNDTTISSPVNVTITPHVNALPTINLITPVNGATAMAPASITLTATATDTDGTIQKVEFFHNATNLIATVTTAPFTYTWNNITEGSYVITAKATDNENGTVTSSPANLTVTPYVTQIYFIHPDHLNTPRAIVNATGEVVWQWNNDDPFGGNAPNESPSGSGNFTFNLRFPGQYFDSELNTHYNYFRDYDPVVGRYVQSDPIGLRGGVNTYGYAAQNPIANSDPRGLKVWSIKWGIGGGVGHIIVGGSVYSLEFYDPIGGNGCKYTVYCAGLGVGLPEFGISSPVVRWDDGKGDCSDCTGFSGMGSQGFATAMAGGGISIGGWLSIPNGPRITGDLMSKDAGAFRVGTAINICRFNLN